jgi:hypothetical protein
MGMICTKDDASEPLLPDNKRPKHSDEYLAQQIAAAEAKVREEEKRKLDDAVREAKETTAKEMEERLAHNWAKMQAKMFLRATSQEEDIPDMDTYNADDE